MSITCPHCGLVCPASQEACDCGWGFAAGNFMRGSHPILEGTPVREPRRLGLWVTFLLLYVPALWTSVSVLSGRVAGTSLWLALASIPMLPAMLWVGSVVFRSERGRAIPRFLVLLACGHATLVAVLFCGAFLSPAFLSPRR